MIGRKMENRVAKRRIIDGFNKKDLTIFDSLFAQEYVLHISGFPDVIGPNALRELFCRILSGLSYVSLKLEDELSEGDRVATRWKLEGEHTNQFLGANPTNRLIQISGMGIDRFHNGLAVEAWQYFDLKGLEKQLGITG